MRIAEVTAVSFGGIEQLTLPLGEGLTVVAGPKGSGKSTWHACLYAALCGHPDAAHQQEWDREFEAQWRPGAGEWLLRAVLSFDDRRQVEVHHDLGRGRCTIEPQDLSALEFAEALGIDRYSYSAAARTREREAEAAIGWLDEALHRLAPSPDEGPLVEAELEYALALGAAQYADRVRRDHQAAQATLEACPPSHGSAAAARQRVAICAAHLAEIDSLPGLAGAIVEARSHHTRLHLLKETLERARTHLTEAVASQLSSLFAGLALSRQDSPLLLDDVAATVDDGRLVQLLDQLLPLASRRQVVVFAHQRAAVGWARGKRRQRQQVRLIRLAGVTTAPADDTLSWTGIGSGP